jgi:hypothetical protein
MEPDRTIERVSVGLSISISIAVDAQQKPSVSHQRCNAQDQLSLREPDAVVFLE